jgi:WxcM-like, C-terminal
MKKISVYDCSVIELQKINNRSGNITPVTNNINIPFEIKRVFYIYDIPSGEDRGAHAHKECHQFLIAASGSFEIEMDDGINKRTIILNRPHFGLYIPPGIWAAEKEFSSSSVCLVLTSQKFNENDYLRDYQQFIKYRNES